MDLQKIIVSSLTLVVVSVFSHQSFATNPQERKEINKYKAQIESQVANSQQRLQQEQQQINQLHGIGSFKPKSSKKTTNSNEAK